MSTNDKTKQLDEAIQRLTDAANSNMDAEDSAINVISGFNQLLKDAVEKATDAGATDSQLVAINEVVNRMEAKKADLATAIANQSGSQA